jgi:hypothetical protein
MAVRLGTGSAPGRPRQVGQMLTLGSSPKLARHPQNILERVMSSTCTSIPITASQVTPVPPPAGGWR